MRDTICWIPTWIIEKYKDDVAFARGDWYAREIIRGNLLLNEGINAIWTLVTGGSETAYSNANARIGVGNSATAAAATQTALQGASTAFKAMDATYPSISGQTVSFRSTFGSTEGNFAWEEFTVDNGTTPNKNLNRLVSSQGTKASGQTWTVTLQLTLS